ncbi:MAG: acyl-ACP--UDP-N-acetylglucosamine O-acyltransferase [bacterium]|nr:acyl-ACP--UDP-N-acetylglucosamine O-acyltransferase [bacterium]
MPIEISSKVSVHKNAVIGKNVTIMPYTVIDENVKIGDNTVIGPNVYITGWTDIGENNKIHAGVVIGGEPQDVSYKNERSYVKIGENNVLREGVTIHRGTKAETSTFVGNNNLFMAYSHVAHNCVVKDNIIMVNLVALGGYVEVDEKAFLSYAVAVHQFCKVGKYVMVAPLSKIGKDVPPFMLVSGPETAVVRGLNVVGLRRAGISAPDREIIKKAYKLLYHSGLNTTQAVEAILAEQDLKDNPNVSELIRFIKSAKRGICSHHKHETESPE